jgi:hypothetical protein
VSILMTAVAAQPPRAVPARSPIPSPKVLAEGRARGRSGLQPQARAPRRAHRPHRDRAGGQPGRAAPYFTQRQTREADARHGIVTQTWSPIGGVKVYAAEPERIAENLDVFDFELAPDEVADIDALDTGQRGGPDPDIVDTNLFSFTVED